MKTREWKMEERRWTGGAGTPLPGCIGRARGPRAPRDGAQGTARPNFRVGAIPLCLCVSAVMLVIGFGAIAQPLEINWHTIDGGGGTSTGGVYSVTGTIGQPDASTTTMIGGNYSVTGGFWALPTVIQTPGAPTLTIVPAGPGLATLSWTPNTPGFVLQETLSLPSTNWINSASGSTNPVTVPVPGNRKFYRLFKP